jgi:hypothetical protein
MVLESKESIKAWSKTYYTIMKDHYQRMPDQCMPNGRKVLAEIKILAGIHNQNHALFAKGLRDWKTHTMAYFDQFEDEDDEKFTSYKQVNGDGEEVLVHDKKEGALVAIGDHIKGKRNFYEFVVKHLDKMNWWDS